MTAWQRTWAWTTTLIHVFVEAPRSVLPVPEGKPRPPFWVRWPIGLWAVTCFRREPEQWLGLAEWFEMMSKPSSPEQQIAQDLICKALRDFAEEREPGIQRRLWQERQDRLKEMSKFEFGGARDR